jgi:hypothetical protein
MADRKISDLTALTTPASGDYLPIVDISEVAAASKNKRITIEELMRGAPNGTAAAPSIAFESDPNTGIYRPGADQVAISTNAVERVEFGTTEVVFNDGGANYDFRIEGDTNSSLFFVDASADTVQINGDVTINDKIIHAGDTNTAIRFPAADTIAFETDGSERARITSTGAVLVGTTSTPTGAGSGAVVAEDRVVISSAGAGRHQTRVGATGTVTLTTGTVVFKFKYTGSAIPQPCLVKLSISQRANSSTTTNSPHAEYAFQLFITAGGVCSLNGAATIFEYTYVRATHLTFADLGGGECTVTLTNPTANTLSGAYKIELLTPVGTWTLDSVTTT